MGDLSARERLFVWAASLASLTIALVAALVYGATELASSFGWTLIPIVVFVFDVGRRVHREGVARRSGHHAPLDLTPAETPRAKRAAHPPTIPREEP